MSIVSTVARAALPWWLPWALGAGLIAALVGGFFTLRAAWRAEGAAQVEAQNQKAIAEQVQRDAALSAKLLAERDAQIRDIEAFADQGHETIKYVAVTRSCGPAIDRAADWVRNAIINAGPAQARP